VRDLAGRFEHRLFLSATPDAKMRRLIDWMRESMCPEMPPFGRQAKGTAPTWNRRRVLIFTENREGTKRYLKAILEQAIEGTDRADERIEVIDGLTSSARRKEVQRRFNTDPAKDPLRILLATDAAREGLNFQAHCADLFHFDLPWNPGRIEQRNGRIDRKLQPALEVDPVQTTRRGALGERGPSMPGEASGGEGARNS
jgi:superfamily II DNA/RNA helicase